MMRANFGNLKEVLELKEKYGMDYLVELQYILNILNQEDELDGSKNNRSR